MASEEEVRSVEFALVHLSKKSQSFQENHRSCVAALFVKVQCSTPKPEAGCTLRGASR